MSDFDSNSSALAFRKVLLSILFCVFAWQTIQSLDIFLSGGTTFSEQTLMEFKQDFPDVSLCPTAFGEDQLDTTNLTMAEELELATVPFFIDYLEIHNNISARITEKILGKFWKISVAYDAYANRLRKCLSFSPGKQFNNGYESLINFYIHGETIPDIFVHLESSKNNLLVTVKNLRREFFLLPEGRYGNRQLCFEINHRKVKLISKEESPCQEERNFNEQDCIESYIERQAGCALPWRLGKTSSYEKACTNSIIYKDTHNKLTRMSEQDIYKMTGCLLPCEFMDYTSVQLLDRRINWNISSHQLHQLSFYLRPGGISYHEEVYVYSMLDFVGNVGGFLGLLLGASLLSLYDGVIIGFKIFQCYFNKT